MLKESAKHLYRKVRNIARSHAPGDSDYHSSQTTRKSRSVKTLGNYVFCATLVLEAVEAVID